MTSNADLIAEARSFRSGCTDGSYLELRLADEIERLNAKLEWYEKHPRVAPDA